MALAHERRVRTRRTWFVVAALAASAAAAFWLDSTTHRGHRARDATLADQSRATQFAAVDPAAAAAQSTLNALPDSLQGSSPPRLPLEAGGHLAHSRAVRDFFDYFLSATSERSAQALDALVRRYIKIQLEGTPAADEAVDAWQRYTAYRIALDQLPQPAATPGGKLDLDAMQLVLDERSLLASRVLGEWSAPFFGTELQRQRNDLARLRIASDPSLSAADKAARLAALDAALNAALPPAERAMRERVQQQQSSIDAIAQMQKQGTSLDAMRAQVTQTLGPQAAARVVQMEQDEQAWQTRYADYAVQRAQIDQRGLAPQDRDAQIAQLRQRFFTRPGDALRAASLDRGAGG
ncbi:lipase secretion chaperone [Paraburkholderia megapolitana]|uniref:Lipase chaperone n=1 Tax=Paraburkholderia megapolitana TaxID=420953 RepID=A0A1I3CZB4_9BURK|nr:lipase secretion chaperone [Paraburkholderia megapolitana]QDQ81607.1 lipase chaperone [Paraburkholderia megapolitana]SFH79812.1 Lipase chaperone LimK [Paraburkholderia megapolitana]